MKSAEVQSRRMMLHSTESEACLSEALAKSLGLLPAQGQPSAVPLQYLYEEHNFAKFGSHNLRSAAVHRCICFTYSKPVLEVCLAHMANEAAGSGQQFGAYALEPRRSDISIVRITSALSKLYPERWCRSCYTRHNPRNAWVVRRQHGGKLECNLISSIGSSLKGPHRAPPASGRA